jgi:hypothetical protein
MSRDNPSITLKLDPLHDQHSRRAAYTPRYVVQYRNEGRSERTPAWPTMAEAIDSARFLAFQNADHITITEE